MNHKQFTTTYNNKIIDFDGKYGGQCVDLMRKYMVEVQSINSYILPPQPYACDFYYNFEKFPGANKVFLKIANTKTNVPKEGDILFWAPWVWGVTGVAGHVAIFDNGNVDKFVSFDQNWPTGSACHFQPHSYRGLLGWLRKK